ncbi:MAG: PQQ-binding-like beta-propeller repeat protein [Thermoguttaceae bacterium]
MSTRYTAMAQSIGAVWGFMVAWAGAALASIPAEQVVKETGVSAGLAVVIGTTDGKLEAGLANGGKMLVQGLALSDEAALRAREHIAGKKLYGLASVEKRDRLDALPYASRIANLLVIGDLGAAEKAGLTWNESIRVTSPGGVVLVAATSLEALREQIAAAKLQTRIEQFDAVGKWVRLKVSRSWGDEWPHNRFRNAGNEKVAAEAINPETQALWIQWLDGDTSTWWGSHAAMCGIVAAEGKLVSLADNEVGALVREGKFWRSLGRMSWILSCRDAYNGTVLWTRPWSGWHQAKRRQTLALHGGLVYTVEAGRLTATNLRDGSVAYVVEAPNDFDDQSWPHCFGEFVALHDLKKGEVWVFEAASGKLRWKIGNAVAGVAVADGKLFAADEAAKLLGGAAQRLLALDLSSGKESWQKNGQDFGEPGAPLSLWFARRSRPDAEGGRVLAAAGKHTVVLKADTGELLHKVSAQGEVALVSGENLFFFDGRVFNLKTGGSALRLSGRRGPWSHAGMGMWACAQGALTEQMFLDALKAGTPARGETADLVRDHSYLGTVEPHITCITGCAVAHGLVYQPEQGCGCAHSNGRMRGMYAIGPVDPLPPDQAFQKPGPLEEGAVYGKTKVGPNSPGDWPMFRRDPARSCAGSGELPRELGVLWRRTLAHRPDAAIVRNSWRAQHNHNQILSAPVVAGGNVYVAMVDEHQVAALKASDGEVLWRYIAGARIDSPPTIHKGLCLFGCRDGWVYCLAAEDGRLVWRRRIAPVDQRICVYGQLESRYPVIGSILVDGDRAYATAGHTCQLHVMLWEFEPFSGKTLAYRPLPRGRFTNDVLVRDEHGGIHLHDKIVVAGKAAAAAPVSPHLRRAGAPAKDQPMLPDYLYPIDQVILSTANTSAMKSRGPLYLRQILADRWTWSGDDLFGFSRHGKLSGPWPGLKTDASPASAVFCIDGTKLGADGPSAVSWHAATGEVWAMALAENGLLLGGPTPEKYEVPELKAENVPAAPKAMPTGRPAEEMFDRSVLSELVRPWWPHQQDPLAAKGFLKHMDPRSGQVLTEIQLASTPVQDGVAVAQGRVYLATADGCIVCLGQGQ